ncbi:MAG: type II 3-dehydroquinate dehydratase [Gemmatimonadota bacterium]
MHGPNLNELGSREPHLYGTVTLAEIDEAVVEEGRRFDVDVVAYQSNLEGALVDWIQANSETVAGFVVNAAGYTHTSVALRDALVAAGRPFVEVHMTNVFAREDFRHASVLADAAVGVVCGFGAASYVLGLRGLLAAIPS